MNPEILGNLNQRHALPTSQSHPDHILTKLSSIPLRQNNYPPGQHLTYQPHQLPPLNAADPFQESLIAGGRVYGGGLRKIEPKELANVPAGSIFRQLGIRDNTSEDRLF